jgi:transcriptional regulator with XRE-family HTH domain
MGILDNEKIKTLREKMKLTQEQAALEAGFKSKQYWYEVESGRRESVSLNTLEKFAKVLGVKAKSLLK